jgi:Xaa-Pro aminopeptidase
MKQKIKQVQNMMKKRKIDAILLLNTEIKDPNIYYFTKLDLEYAFLIIQQNKEPVFLVSALEYTRAQKYSTVKKVKQYKKPLEEIKKIIGKNKKIGINTNRCTVATFKALKKKIRTKYTSINKILRTVRITKTKKEIVALKKAASIGDSIFSKLIKALKNKRKMFKTELDIAHFIENEAKKQNTVPSFETIVATGRNAALPHYHPQKIPIKKGFCVLDFGVRYKHYISDMSRTIFFGAPTEKDKQQYQKVLNANLNAIKALKIGKKCKDIDATSRKERNYPHSLGHGIGIEVHEAPNLSPHSKDKIEQDMCFTIEPGMYTQNKFGIRIEDDIWMSKGGPIILTKSTKKLLSFPL